AAISGGGGSRRKARTSARKASASWSGEKFMSRSPHEAAGARDRGQMRIDAAELGVHHRHTLEHMAHRAFLGDADAAVQLDRLLRNESRRAPNLHLHRRERLRALGRV